MKEGKRYFFSLILIFIITLLGLTSGYYICIFIFGKLESIPLHIIFIVQSLTSAVIYFLGWKAFIYMHWRFANKHKRFNLSHFPILSGAVEAMNKIASGDFNVLVKTNELDPFNEVADNVNRMAKELGSLEKLRQDFISDVSHEIQSPLTSISGFAALLKKGSLNKDQISHYASIIETESKRLSKLSENLLRLSNLESEDNNLNLKNYQINKQIESVLLMLEPQWSAKNITLDISLEETMICGDEDLLSQVFINLLNNAIKFTPENGNIGVNLYNNEDGVECKVSDTGIGISSEDQPRIFERFYKADKARNRSLGGNGLGLSIVKKIIDLHGGKISLTSEIGKGTEFIICLPKVYERK
ncbi:sensor histidine kinase [Clostridium beijerinckii]|uniref:histidine kinase n=1 Tax=Clostridium beijerinckii TaxID=1520 RepID=A0A1S8PYK9_CLOBE|nr:HAMP domain-containing sensor histidine kinase [Clostridium beijerinckii]NMF03776.1 HAMP domain-containing sensor histidine kinase [Clostridium beijerinckii]NSB17146.1 signal transduction histidine kinase [Clostridium beijerinckii]OOM33761.1 alkaline phosphatase synthesis sensor protein PhoR [Clostridium beijerinckii]